MNKRLRAALVVMGTLAATSLYANSPAPAAVEAIALVCDNTRDDPYTGTYASVTVPEGASCYLRNAEVTGNLKALHGAVNVYVINTDVARNIHIRGAERNVKIGPSGCKVDPVVGNNLKVVRSHNVTICFMSVNNNIMVRRIDGRIGLKRNTLGQTLGVTNNLAYRYQPGDGHHRAPGAIRMHHNEAGQQIVVRNNADRGLILWDNTPTPVTD
jgi:hypothetical protein